MSNELEFIQRPPLWSPARLVISTLSLVFALWFMIFMWPTLYRYDHSNGKLIQISRMTGDASVLTDSGWVPLSTGAPR